jgi:cob(I)alamin adenosyltransferase
MVISTKTGDNGTTGTLFGKRLDKSHELFSCLGDLDELSAFLGLSKSALQRADDLKQYSYYLDLINNVQLSLINLMGELNCLTIEDRDKYISKFSPLQESDLQSLDNEVNFLQGLPELQQKTWVLYGKTDVGACFDVSSKICRRAERSFHVLNSNTEFHRELILKYINRLSDLLYLLARYFDYIYKKL